MGNVKFAFLLAFAAVASASMLSSGCIFQERNVTSIAIYDTEYRFNTNLLESLKIPINDPAGAKALFDNATLVCLVFDGSNEQENSYFVVVSYNVVLKLTTYYTNFNDSKNFTACNSSEAEKADAIIELKGPRTGATDNSVILEGKKVVIQGRTSKELEKAGDRLILAVFGIERLD